MTLTWLRRALECAAWLALAGASSLVVAGESLPPLRVDPTLLGGAPLKPAAVPAPAPVPASAPTVAQPATTPATSPSPVPELPKSAAQVTPVAPPPAARDLPAPTPVAAPAATASVPAARPQSVPSQPTAAPATKRVEAAPVARGLPPLRVDPSLLGGTPLPKVAVDTQPPQVAERPTLPPLYSAHVAAGAIPHPSTTPFTALSKKESPTLVSGDRISGVNEVEVEVIGDAQLHRAGDSLQADRIVYRQADDEVEATGNVRLASPDTTITGPRLRMRLEESVGEFETPVYAIRRQQAPVDEPALTLSGLPAVGEDGRALVTTGRKLSRPPITGSGSADKLEFRGEDLYHLENASFSTCAPGKRDWEIRMDDLDLDYNAERGKGSNAVVRFMDVPLFYTPWMSFSLNNQRKSGFLPGTIGSTSKSGFEVAVPYYWNIAPHMDATITPRVLARRGTQWNAEFRYLLDTKYRPPEGVQTGEQGQVRIEYLPSDKLAKRDRFAYAMTHTQILANGLVGSLNLNGVSDSDYFSDLSTRVSQVSQGNMLRQATLAYGGPWYSATMNMQGFQTLQGLAKPYQRLPQIAFGANRYDLPVGMVFNLSGEYVNYDHETNLTTRRTTLYPQLSLPWASSAFFLTPKVGVHTTRYELSGLDRPDAAAWSAVPDSQNRTVPIASLDGGMFLEREAEWFGQSLVQTLEPRAYYVFIPKRDQSKIPVFDTSRAGFTYASMFSENRYAGNDRIGNANELTLALTSRFLDTKTGAEMLRATVGQRYYFTKEDATASLPGETLRTSKNADLLAAFTGKVLPDTYADVGWQYSPSLSRTERLTLGGRYRPAIGKIINAGYRYAHDTFGQIDVSGQWPLGGGWHGVGRYNYSTREKRVIETIGGVEYNAGCWVGRFVIQRLATIADKPTTALFFQLELNDFSKIGSNPLQILRRNVPGYGVINQPTGDPVFAEN